MGKLDGRCLCGAVRYEVKGSPLPLSTVRCNCKDCQRASGTAFAVVVPVRASTLHVYGELATYDTTGTDSHERRQRKFCPQCGSPILSILAEAPEIVWLKAGTFEDASWVSPSIEAWRVSAQPWTDRLPRRPRLRRGPPTVALRATRPLMRAIDRISRGRG
jgi:hypothetical protein